MKEILIPSKRGTDIPVSVYEGNGKGPLLLMAHSFRSQKEEDGRYSYIGEKLSAQGFLCIAPDFAGNGSSKEAFVNYSLSSCIDDLESCYAYAKKNYEFDEDRRYLLGYSIGGRIISLFLERHPEFSKLVFWASLLETMHEDDKFLEQDLSQLRKQCDEIGYCDFYDIFEKETIQMSKQLIDDLLYEDALSPLNDFKGEALIVQGEKDITIDPQNGKIIASALYNAKEKKLVFMKDADHGFGLWDGRKQDNERLLEETIRFLSKSL